MGRKKKKKNEEFHLKIHEGDVGKYVILCGDPGRCEKIARYFDDAVFVGSNREYTIYNGTRSRLRSWSTAAPIPLSGSGHPEEWIRM